MLILTEETSSLQKFREVVSDLTQDENVLIRFLRARNYDINNAEQMLRHAMEWRKEVGLDNYYLKKWNFPPHFYSALQYRLFGRDYEGAPIAWAFIGTWTFKQMLENEDTEQIQRYCYAAMEQGFQQTVVCSSPGNVVVDLEGLTYSQATHIPSLKFAYLAFQIIEQCFPETIKAVYVINVPWIFFFAYNFFKPVIAQRTLAKIKIFYRKEEWHTECLKRFPRSSIVPELQPPMDSTN